LVRIPALVALLLVALPAGYADAGRASRQECITACEAMITSFSAECKRYGVGRRRCRRAVLAKCRRFGVPACAPTATTTPSHGCSLEFDENDPQGYTCGGLCPSGYVCGGYSFFGSTVPSCRCVLSPEWRIPCETGGGKGWPTCAGTCPGTLSCLAGPSPNGVDPGDCLCSPKLPCAGGSGAPVCDGACPVSTSCALDVGNECRCLPGG
jgi:hypothetical protein